MISLQTHLLYQYVLNLAKYDQNYDIRDRARFLRQLVFPDEVIHLKLLHVYLLCLLLLGDCIIKTCQEDFVSQQASFSVRVSLYCTQCLENRLTLSYHQQWSSWVHSITRFPGRGSWSKCTECGGQLVEVSCTHVWTHTICTHTCTHLYIPPQDDMFYSKTQHKKKKSFYSESGVLL